MNTLPRYLVGIIMEMVREMVLEDRGEEWRALMEEVRVYERLGTPQELFLDRKGVENVGGSSSYRVREFAMAGGSAEWYNYQLHVSEGSENVRVYREDRRGLQLIRGGVMVMTFWGEDEQVVVLERDRDEVAEFVWACQCFSPPIEYSVLDDPSLIFPD